MEQDWAVEHVAGTLCGGVIAIDRHEVMSLFQGSLPLYITALLLKQNERKID